MYLDTEDILHIAVHCAQEFHTEIRSPSALIALSSILHTPLGKMNLEATNSVITVFSTKEEKIQEFYRLLKVLRPLKTHNDLFGLVTIALYNRSSVP